LDSRHAPAEVLPWIVQTGLQKDLEHAYKNEASPEHARRLREHLRANDYRGSPVETLRQSLLPVLDKKAAVSWSASAGPCAHLTCPTGVQPAQPVSGPL
jgi:hypothetical protein